jgi:hypothetical protein
MDRSEAEAAEQMLRDWRKMSADEYDAFARSL